MVVFTIPHSKPPEEEVGAVEFARVLSNTIYEELTVTGEEKEFDFHYNTLHSEIVNVETAAGRNTQYVKEFLQKIKSKSIHVDIRSFDVEDDLLKKFDVVVSYLEGLTDMGMVDGLVNTLSTVCLVDKVEAEYSTHRLALVAETLFDKPSIIIYVNEGAVDLYSAVAEELVKFLLERPVVRKIG